MVPEIGTEKRLDDPAFPLVARAICESKNGNKLRLYVSDLTRKGAFILSMKPPPIGEKLAMTLYPLGSPPLPPVEAPVIGVRIDPSDASRTGFEVVFSSLEENLSRQLTSVLNSLDRSKPPPTEPQIRSGAELRVYPRVQVDFKAYIELPNSQAAILAVQDISMSGAMLLLGDKPLPVGMELGSEISIDFFSSGPTEHICVKAQVVRLSQNDQPNGASVKFLDVDEITSRRIEGLILDALTGEGSWLYYSEPV